MQNTGSKLPNNQMEMSKNFCTQIRNPEQPEGSKIEATIPHHLILNFYKFYPVRYENFRATKIVLENPLRIFSGVRQLNEGGFCFTGRPSKWYIKEDIVAPFPANLVFAVYLNPRYFVYECRAEPSADDDADCPEDWQNRFKALIWKNIS
jgi:hypothetical protein